MATKPESDQAVIERQEEKIEQPPMYKLIMLNDDYTPMEFVVEVLTTILQKSPPEAERIMLQIHLEGKGVCGLFTKEIAEFKKEKIEKLAQKEEHPLQCVLEAEGPAPSRSSGMKR